MYNSGGENVMASAVDTVCGIAYLQHENAELRAKLTEAREKLAAYEDAFKPKPTADDKPWCEFDYDVAG